MEPSYPIHEANNQSQIQEDVTSFTGFDEDFGNILEKLPTELVWTIFEYAHESVSELRLTSRWFKSAVDKFASQQFSMILVEKISFSLFEWQKAKIDIKIEIPPGKVQLFRLNRRLRQIPSLITKSFKPIVDIENSIIYTSLNLKCESVDTKYVKTLIECIGRKVKTIVIKGCHDGKASIAVAKAVKQFHCNLFGCCIEEVSNHNANFLLNLIDDNQIEHLSLRVNEVTSSDPVNLLFRLSSRLHSFHILQTARYPHDNQFFGISGGDWASIIREMFSNKLDTLSLDDKSKSTFLDDVIINTLMQSLPYMGKRLWFSASISIATAHKHKGIEYTENDHIVKFESIKRPANVEEWIIIKHTSRADNYA